MLLVLMNPKLNLMTLILVLITKAKLIQNLYNTFKYINP